MNGSSGPSGMIDQTSDPKFILGVKIGKSFFNDGMEEKTPLTPDRDPDSVET
jgi:hypothetical protein